MKRSNVKPDVSIIKTIIMEYQKWSMWDIGFDRNPLQVPNASEKPLGAIPFECFPLREFEHFRKQQLNVEQQGKHVATSPSPNTHPNWVDEQPHFVICSLVDSRWRATLQPQCFSALATNEKEIWAEHKRLTRWTRFIKSTMYVPLSVVCYQMW